MPFNATKYPLQQTFYTDYLKPKMAELNLPIHRVDSPEKFTHGDINNRMLAQIRQSKCLIADLTGNNLGVLFEAGYAMGLGRPVFFICEKSQKKKFHFDISTQQVIFYQANTMAEAVIDIHAALYNSQLVTKPTPLPNAKP